VYGGDFAHNKIGQWTQYAGNTLIQNGWNVRDLQAIYPAPPVPPWTEIAKAVIAGGGLTTKSAAAVALIIKTFRDAVSNSWQAVKAELEAAYARCPGRKILLAGYSQGAILMRYVVPRLDPKILAQIVSVDLFADPTEQRVVDGDVRHTGNADARLTEEGIDTFAGEVLNTARNKPFLQTRYPTTVPGYPFQSIAGHTFQYCADGDLVCDFTLANIDPRYAIPLEGKIHASYEFGGIGVAAAQRLGRFHTVTMDWATGTWSLDGHQYTRVNAEYGRFQMDPRNFLGGAPRLCYDQKAAPPDALASIHNPTGLHAWQGSWADASYHTEVTLDIASTTRCGPSVAIFWSSFGSDIGGVVLASPQGNIVLPEPLTQVPSAIRRLLHPVATELQACVRSFETAYPQLFAVEIHDGSVTGLTIWNGC
jgi:hypothetical protein